MSILSDGEIRELRPRPFEPWDDNAIQPASYEVTLDDRIVTANGIPVKSDSDGGWWLGPGEFWLGSTAETISVSRSLVAQVNGKSTLGRQGLLVHATAGFIDPGFTGQITLELANVGEETLRLAVGQRIAQIVFMRMGRAAERPYGDPSLGSHYQGQTGPTVAHSLDLIEMEDRR